MEEQPFFVRQANALAKSGQELELIEKRIVYLAMSRIRNSDTELLTHRIYIQDLKPYIGGDPWRVAQKAATNLLKRVVIIRGEDNAFTAFNWTTLVRYVPASQSDDSSSYIEIRFNEELSPFLLQLRERYNAIPLLHVLPMPSVNSQKLYEVLWHDSFAGKKQHLTYDIPALKFEIGLRNLKNVKGKTIWQEKYNNWRDFQKVLRRAQQDFESYGSLRFTFTGLTKGRATQQVRFYLTLAGDDTTTEQTTIDPAEQLRNLQLADQLDTAGYHQDPMTAIDTYGYGVVEMALKLAREAERQAARSNNPVTNLGGLIHQSLKTGLAKRRLERQAVPRDERPDPRALAKMMVDAFDTDRREAALHLWEAMRAEEKAGFPDLMRLELSPFELTRLDKAGWQGAIFESLRNQALLSLYADALPKHVQDIEAFAARFEHAQLDDATRQVVLAEAKRLI